MRRIAVALAVVLAVGVVVGLGGYLVRQQKRAADQLNRSFAERTALSADLFGDTLQASESGIQEQFAADVKRPEVDIPQPLPLGVDNSIAAGAALDATDGRVLSAAPAWFGVQAAGLTSQTAYREAAEGGRFTWGGIVTTPSGPHISVYVPVESAEGRRVLVLLLPMAAVTEVMQAFLATLNVFGAQGYVVDDAGLVIVSTTGAESTQPVPDAGLASALGRGSAGRTGDRYFAAAGVPASTWRVAFVTSEEALQEPLRSSRRVSWQLFAAFAAAMAAMVLVGGASLVGSARLAHARRHDTLTGLPNRSLFLEMTRRALQDRRPVAAIFIDLDGFKPVNDTYGHAVGDRLLTVVAERLIESMRPGDYVSRFGGDEFLVLCRNLRDPHDVLAIAERLAAYIAEPYEIDRRVLLIGSSMGVALSSDATSDPDTLIHNADLAMYKAKQAGRGRIELFSEATESR